MHDDAVVALVDKVCATADVIQVGRVALPCRQLLGVRDKPHVNVIPVQSVVRAVCTQPLPRTFVQSA